MRKKRFVILFPLLLCLLFTGCAASGATSDSTIPVSSSQATADVLENTARPSYQMVDSHLHYLDFMQETDSFELLVEQMDAANVSHAVIFGMAMAKQWDEHAPNEPTYYLSNDSRTYYFSATDYMMMQDFMAQPEEIRNRFFPFVCGVNPNDKNAANHIRKILEDYPGQFYGIGELMSRHDDLTALTYGEPPRADHPAFLEIYDLAAEYDMPVLIHHNISGSYMDEPIYLEEMKNALAHNRDTNIIWAHVGISRRVEISNLLEITDEMLRTNPNLYYDISWVVYDDYINSSSDSLRAWAELIEKYPDRFMIGTDVVGHWSSYSAEVFKYYALLEYLSPDAVQNICTDNILSLIKAEQLPVTHRFAAGK